MKKIACVALLIAASLNAQNAPAPATQQGAPAEQAATQAQQQQRPAVTVRELPLNEEATKRLLDLGYSFSSVPGQQKLNFGTPTRCAIPLMQVVPNPAGFSGKVFQANPSIDPKIVLAPTVPACPPTIAPPPVASPTETKVELNEKK